nr:MFS transporter [Streptomyces specialis]
MSVSPTTSGRGAAAPRPGNREGAALAVIALAQLMVVLDATIVNVALPRMQDSLGFTTEDLSWVVNAYTLAFGGLLLLGGRIGDLVGRRRALIGGLALFGAASLFGGLAPSGGWLLAARVAQGAGAAVIAPAVLALIATTFATEEARTRAFGVFAGVSGAGAAIGLLAGGLLTEWLSWRWVLFVNVPVAALLALAAPRSVAESPRGTGRFDLAGASTSTLGIGALVLGFITASQDGWRRPGTLGAFAAAVLLLLAFVAVERRTAQPITPLRLFADRDRGGIYVVALALTGSLMGLFFFLTLFLQNTLAYSPLETGLAFLPVSLSILMVAGLVTGLLPRIGLKPPLVAGAALLTGALLWFSRIDAGTGYLDGLLGPMLLYGVGTGLIFMPLTMIGVSGVEERDTGAASGLLNTTQQVGGALGLAILVTVYGTVTRNETGDPRDVLAEGAASGFLAAAVFAVVALLVCLVVIRPDRSALDAPVLVPPAPQAPKTAVPVEAVEAAGERDHRPGPAGRGPRQGAAARSRSRTRGLRALPVTPRGSAGQAWTWAGTSPGRSRPVRNGRSSGSAPGSRSTTTACVAGGPPSGPVTATTAASRTAGCSYSAASTATEETRSGPSPSTSSRRSNRYRCPSVSCQPRSPVQRQPPARARASRSGSRWRRGGAAERSRISPTAPGGTGLPCSSTTLSSVPGAGRPREAGRSGSNVLTTTAGTASDWEYAVLSVALGNSRSSRRDTAGGSGAEAIAIRSTESRACRVSRPDAIMRSAVHGVIMTEPIRSASISVPIRSTSSTGLSTRAAGEVSAMIATVVALDVVPSGMGASSGAGVPNWSSPSGPRPKVRLPCGLVNAFAGPVVPDVYSTSAISPGRSSTPGGRSSPLSRPVTVSAHRTPESGGGASPAPWITPRTSHWRSRRRCSAGAAPACRCTPEAPADRTAR